MEKLNINKIKGQIATKLSLNLLNQKSKFNCSFGHQLTWPGGSMASNLSTPNIPKFESVKVPEDITKQHN